jgi:predicted permease
MAEIFRRIRYLVNRRRFDEELESDMEFHRDMAARHGLNNFGNVLRMREQASEAWGWTWLDRLGQDLRFASRILFRSPGFTLMAVLVLAIGIGVNMTAFSFFNLAALQSLPLRDPDSLVRLQRRSPEIRSSGVPYPMVALYRDNAKTLSAVMAMMPARLALENDPQPVKTNFVTPNFFRELGAMPALGRLFDSDQENAFGPDRVVVLSFECWQQRFGTDPSILGRTIHLNKKPVTVIGIAPHGFSSLDDERSDVWLPIQEQPYLVEGSDVLTDMSAGAGSVSMWGRLAPGVKAKAAEQELLALTNNLRRQYPKVIWDNEFIKIDPAGHLHVPQEHEFEIVSMVAALMLLILAVTCANLGGLMLARGVTREHEIGIRLAIGASRGRIFRQLFTESMLLAIMGSAVGLGLSYVAIRVVLVTTDAPGWMSATPDWRVLLFSLGIAFVAAAFFGFAPALQIARQRQRKTIARQVLVSAQVAASCVLLIVAGLLVRAVHHALYADPGFGFERVLMIDPGLDQHGYATTAAQVYLNQLETRLRAVPGVTSVALSSMPPLGHYKISSITTDVGGRQVEIHPYTVTPEFFQAMNIPLLSGRNLMPGEKNAVIVSESLARRQWPGENPVGKKFWDSDVVVGVAGSARMNAMNDGNSVEMYHAAQLAEMPGMVVVVKTAGTPENFTPAVKAIVESLDPKLFPQISLLEAAFRKDMGPVQTAAMIVSLLGVVAVLLAGLGILGLVAYSVSQRMKEIAIRMALGAKRAQVLAAVLRQFAWPVFLGLAIGTASAAGASKLMGKALYGISNLDPISYVAAVGLLAAMILLAGLIPARRALRVDLSKALHYE